MAPNSLPQMLLGRKETLAINGVSAATYKIQKSEQNAEIFVTSSLINFILRGEKHLISEHDDAVISAGEFFFLRKGNYIMSSIVPPKGDSFSALLLFLEDEFVREFIAENRGIFGAVKADQNPSFYHRATNPLLESSALSLLPYFSQESPMQSSILKYKMWEIFLNIIADDADCVFRKTLLSIGEKKGDDLADYMEQNYHLPLTIEEFAKNTFRSLSSFKKDFKERYGKTPKVWINEKRLLRARMILSQGNRNVTETAFLCGFDSLSHFIQMFRERFDATPKQMQNQNRHFLAPHR